MKNIPIKAAKDFAEMYDQAQVIIFTLDRKDNLVHTLSYGETLEDCAQAAEGANRLRKALDYPPREPSQMRRLQEENKRLREENRSLREEVSRSV